jgi:hypothetical protein
MDTSRTSPPMPSIEPSLSTHPAVQCASPPISLRISWRNFRPQCLTLPTNLTHNTPQVICWAGSQARCGQPARYATSQCCRGNCFNVNAGGKIQYFSPVAVCKWERIPFEGSASTELRVFQKKQKSPWVKNPRKELIDSSCCVDSNRYLLGRRRLRPGSPLVRAPLV